MRTSAPDVVPNANVVTQQATVQVWLLQCGVNANIYQLETNLKSLRRGSEVIVRTDRGLELGTVLNAANSLQCSELFKATYVRRSQPEDRLLWTQLQKLSQTAGQACQDFLEQTGSRDVLIEVEPLLDGKTIFFHFLGEPTESTEAQVEQLAEVYRKKVASSEFANRLETGCGPGCGTAAKSSCGTSSGCSSCSLSSGCSVRKPAKT
ncbi:hypothetical protein SH449x_003753 [Pirellulaceae bacterium SH449]